jgi:hypothetical protein
MCLHRKLQFGFVLSRHISLAAQPPNGFVYSGSRASRLAAKLFPKKSADPSRFGVYRSNLGTMKLS